MADLQTQFAEDRFVPLELCHYWVVSGTTKRMPINSTGEGIVCTWCGKPFVECETSVEPCPERVDVEAL